MRFAVRNWRRALFGLLLVVLAGLSIAFSLRIDASPVATVLKGNFPLDAGALDRLDISANNSPSLAMSPVDSNNLAVANRVDSPVFSCALHVSANGGSTWTKTAISLPAGQLLKCFDPEPAFDAGGTLYLSFVTLKDGANLPDQVWISSSSDGGRSLSAPEPVLGPLAYQVRLLADKTRAGRLYLFWLQAHNASNFGFPETGQPILFARSDDGGKSWQGPVRVSAPVRQRVLAPSPGLGPNGELYMLYLDLAGDSMDYGGEHEGRGGRPYSGRWKLVLARSADRGADWAEALVTNEVVPTRRILPFLPPFPSLAVDQTSGAIYAAFHDGRLDVSDVYLWSSTDGGARWSAPRRVNDTPARDGRFQYLPAVAVARDGRVDVLYYDRRADPKNVRNEVSLQYSYTGGADFSSRLRVSDRAFDSRIGFGRERRLAEIGSRLALVSTTTRDLAIWADTRAGTLESGKQDLSRALISFRNPGPAERFLHYSLRSGGAALGLAGLVLVVLWLRSLRRLQPNGDWVERLTKT